jgi:hypothetical protein
MMRLNHRDLESLSHLKPAVHSMIEVESISESEEAAN